MHTRTQAAKTHIKNCILIYKTIGIINHELVEHPDLPGRWLLVIYCQQLHEEVFAALSTIWLICKAEWMGLAGVQVNNLEPISAEALDLVSERQPR